MRYAKIRKMDISNGEGIGVALFVQGCHFHCKGCFNQDTWDFNGGKEWTKEVENSFIALAGKDYIERISILGGEPLAFENSETVFKLIGKLKKAYPKKKIWLYTGYTVDEFLKTAFTKLPSEQFLYYKYMLTSAVDVIVDGRFEIEKQDLYNDKILWAGSTNQRVIKRGEKQNCGRYAYGK